MDQEVDGEQDFGTSSLFCPLSGKCLHTAYPASILTWIVKLLNFPLPCVAPLMFLGSSLCRMGCKPTFLLGARSGSDLVQLEHFESFGRVLLTTEDDSAGEKGFVTNHSVLASEKFDRICTCGPKPMMVAVARYASEHDICCEVSLENKMACGLGACLCCVEPTHEGNLCVCKQGPVFNINQLLWHV